MTDILKEICSYKKEIVARDKQDVSLAELRKQAENITSAPRFLKNITQQIALDKNAIIAEIKQKSPSQGLMQQNIDVAKIAAQYAKGDAAAISVLTDEKYFGGKNEYVALAKQASNLPILRKDFMIDEYQIYQAKTIGAEAILLIMSALSVAQAQEFEALAFELGLDVLIETHNAPEIEQALQLKSKLIGVNNRNLKTLDTSLDNIKNLQQLIPNDKILVCESGINSLADFEQLKELKLNCFLIGGFLMKNPEPNNILEDLVKF